MSIFMKTLILILLFIFLNILSIYTFNYGEYFTDTKKEFHIENDSGFKIFNKEFFKNSDYKDSEFSIYKQDGIVILQGTFSNQKVLDQIVDLLQINKTSDIKFENTKTNDKLLGQIAELINPLKDFFENGAKIIVKDNTLFFEGVLKNKEYKELVNKIFSKLTVIKTNISILDPVILEEKTHLDSQNVTNNNIEIENNNNINENISILTKNDIQLLINNTLLENKIIFERKSTVLTQESKDSIKKIADILKKYDTYKVEVAGHTDSRGNKDLNKKISQDRAQSVKVLLESFGVLSSRIVAVGYGNERPIAKDDENGLSEINRRVEFNIGE